MPPGCAYTVCVPVSSARHIPVLALSALALHGGGCATADPTPEAGPDAHGSFAVLQVERARFDGALPGERFEHFEIDGRVARFSGLEREEAAALIGVGDLSEPEELDACEAPATVLRDEELGGELDRSEIELVDVGVIEVRAGDRSLSLEPQSFPGLLSLLQGAIYGSSEGEGVGWEGGAEWTFSARGAAGVGGFDATVEAPQELTVLRVGSDDPNLVPPTVERGLDLPIRWDPGTSHDDVVRIELGWTQFGTEMRVRCAAVDDGSFVIPASVLRQLPDAALVTAPRLVLHRERRRGFGAAGLDEGVVVVSLTESFDARVR